MLRLCSVATPGSQREADLRKFLCRRYWLPESDFPLCSDLFRALGMTGDDCHEFMNDLAETFNLDLADFVWPKYHLGESEAMDVRAALRPLRRFAGIRTQPLDRDLIPLSIDHLSQVIEHGAWFDPDVVEAADNASISQSITRLSAKLRAGGVPRRPNR